jgi:7-cyano-7-deazaguanine synthase in queuosine biosynthesis
MIDIVIREWNCKIIPLYFRRDSRNQKWEEKAVDFFYKFYKDKYPENIVELLKIESQIPSRINKEHMDADRRLVMGLPMRNSTMMNMAITQAVYLSSKYNEAIRTVLVGSIGDDLKNPESGLLSNRSQTLHTCICLGEWHWQIISPLTDTELKGRPFFKAGLIQYAKSHNIPIEQTRSCFGKIEEPCGECLACQTRQKAFEAAKSTS